MNAPAFLTRATLSLLLLAAAGSVNAANNTSALLGASEPLVLELGSRSVSSQPISVQAISVQPISIQPIGAQPIAAQPIPTGLGQRQTSVTDLVSVMPTKVTAQRLPGPENTGFDFSTLISFAFGIVGLLWIRRRTADL